MVSTCCTRWYLGDAIRHSMTVPSAPQQSRGWIFLRHLYRTDKLWSALTEALTERVATSELREMMKRLAAHLVCEAVILVPCPSASMRLPTLVADGPDVNPRVNLNRRTSFAHPDWRLTRTSPGGLAMAIRDAVLVDDNLTDSRFTPDAMSEETISQLCVPILVSPQTFLEHTLKGTAVEDWLSSRPRPQCCGEAPARGCSDPDNNSPSHRRDTASRGNSMALSARSSIVQPSIAERVMRELNSSPDSFAFARHTQLRRMPVLRNGHPLSSSDILDNRTRVAHSGSPLARRLHPRASSSMKALKSPLSLEHSRSSSTRAIRPPSASGVRASPRLEEPPPSLQPTRAADQSAATSGDLVQKPKRSVLKRAGTMVSFAQGMAMSGHIAVVDRAVVSTNPPSEKERNSRSARLSLRPENDSSEVIGVLKCVNRFSFQTGRTGMPFHNDDDAEVAFGFANALADKAMQIGAQAKRLGRIDIFRAQVARKSSCERSTRRTRSSERRTSSISGSLSTPERKRMSIGRSDAVAPDLLGSHAPGSCARRPSFTGGICARRIPPTSASHE